MPNNELEELILQKKELEKRIKDLRRTSFHVNNVKFEQRVYPTGVVEWAASVRTSFDCTGRPHYAAVARKPTKQAAIEELERNVADLSKLLELVKEE